MALYLPARFYSGRPLTVPATVATVPANSAWIITDIELAASTGQDLSLSIAGTFLFDALSLAANSHTQWTGRILMLAGEDIVAFTGSGIDPTSVIITGLQGPA